MRGMDDVLARIELSGKVDHRRGQQFVAGTGFAGDAYARVHRIEPHGFASYPVKGGIALAVSRCRRDTTYALGGENPGLRPELPQGGTAIYDHNGNIISIVTAAMRIVHAATVHIVAPEIVLEGTVRLGGAGAAKPVSVEGTLDSGGNADQSNFASGVYAL